MSRNWSASLGKRLPLFPCDVSSDDEIKAFFENVRRETDRVDLMLHSLAYAPREAFEGDFVSTTREAFRVAHDVSAYSLVALAREAAPLMTDGGSIVAMTYYGSEKVVPHYNVMGVAKASLEASARYLAYDLGPKKIRVNCISAGPVQTLAARGISGFTSMLKHYQERAPLKRSCDPAELGATGVFPRQRRRGGDNRPGHLRRWRLSDNGHVTVSFGLLLLLVLVLVINTREWHAPATTGKLRARPTVAKMYDRTHLARMD